MKPLFAKTCPEAKQMFRGWQHQPQLVKALQQAVTVERVEAQIWRPIQVCCYRVLGETVNGI